jgi:hypothetical protein
MTEEQRKTAEARRKASRPCRECKARPEAPNTPVVHAEGCSVGAALAAAAGGEKAKAPADLSDPTVQQAILEPEPVQLTIGGEPTELYLLPARWARKFVALFVRVMNAAAGQQAPFTIRIGTALENDDGLAADVYRFIARAEREPGGDVADEELAERAEEIAEVASFEEVRDALDRLCEMCRVAEIIAGPKARAASQTTTS